MGGSERGCCPVRIEYRGVSEMGCVPTKDANSSNQKSLLMLGLDGAGSTTILYRLILNKSIETIPTLGFNQESLSFEGMEYDIWDIGGLDKVRGRLQWKRALVRPRSGP